MKEITMVRILLAAFLAIFLSGCGLFESKSEQAFLKAQADALTAQSTARVEEAKAAAEEARAVIALSTKIDAGGATAYLVAKAMKGMNVQPAQVQQVVQRPRDWLDYLQGVSGVVSAVGNIAVPIMGAVENGRTQRYLADANVRSETVRQAGESSRIESVGSIAIAATTAPRPPTSVTTITAGGDVVNGGGTIDRRNCAVTAGNGAQGGAGSAAGLTGTPGGVGGAGGPASGSCQ